ncbi:hypothetical protein [Variovorax sp. RA8]|uniref:hypothetical protein n=1 Tax=Variovorax sp. (strain JCM 16519 / RA8) TaxID=662548 RepID=UPI0013180680|nr:hypothetical protein [Variovorax sp. RA8]VTU34193.1 hypothetical protein RA8CHR_04924 [Variovorax sp. RA8]
MIQEPSSPSLAHVVGEEAYYEPSILGVCGSAHSVSSDPEPEDVVSKLHQVVKEITGKAVETPHKPRMGFL